MKIGLLPLFSENMTQQGEVQHIGTEYYSAYALTRLVSFFEKHMPTVSISIEMLIPPLLKKRPDLIVIWVTSSCFHLVEPIATLFKQNLDVPLILGGPHISHLPQSLPESVDIGMLGEPELTLKALVQLFIKDPEAGPMKYGRIPGLIYQSRGRIYSGKPAQVVPNLDQLPFPKHQLFRRFPGTSIPVLQTSRGQPSMLSLASAPPSPKLRFHSPAYIVNELELIKEHYELMHQHLPLPAFLKAEMRPVLIGDEVFVHHVKHLKAIVDAICQRELHKEFSFIVNTQVMGLGEEQCRLLKQLNVRKVVLHFGCLNQPATPELATITGAQLATALKTAKSEKLDLIGCMYLNHHLQTTRKDLAKMYGFLQKYHPYFERLKVNYCPPLPGSELWTHFQKEHHLDSSNFERVYWQTFQMETYQPNAPIANKHLDKASFNEVHDAFDKLSKDPTKFLLVNMSQGGALQGYQSIETAGSKSKERKGRMQYAQLLMHKYIKPSQRVLHVFVNPAHDIAEFIPQNYDFKALRTNAGHLPFEQLKGQYDFILLTHTLETLREPEKSLRRLKEYMTPQSKLLLQTVNAQSAAFIMTTLMWPLLQSFYSNPNLKYYSEKTVLPLIEKVGLTLVNTDYTIMNNISAFRGPIEGLVKQIQNFWPAPIHKENFSILELMMLLKIEE